MAQKLIVIIGITGNQGSSVADVFINLPGWKIRGITRDPTKPSSKAWIDKGAEVVAGDLNDVETLKPAFKGANVIFGATDFWQYLSLPSTIARAAKEGRTNNEVAADIETTQGKNIIDAAAATIDTLDRFVLSTLSSTRKWSNGKLTWNYHFDAKWAAVEHLRSTHPELDAKTSLLQLAFFMTNWTSGGLNAPKKQADGTFKLTLPVRPDRRVPMTYARKDAGAFVKALVEAAPGKNLLGAGDVLTWPEWVKKWGEFNGVQCTYEELPIEEFYKYYPGNVGLELGDMYKYISDYGYDGSDPSIVLPWDLGVDVKVTSVNEYFKLADFSKVLNPQ